MDTLHPGDRIRIRFADASTDPREATVCTTLSDQQEGLSPEVEDYVACWLEVTFTACDDRHGRASVALGTDFQYTLDGRRITIEKLTG